MKHRIPICLVFSTTVFCATIFCAHPLFATGFYECVDTNGKKRFQDRPCDGQSVKKLGFSSAQPKGNKKSKVIVVAPAKLIGTWVDYKSPSMAEYRTHWIFSGNKLTITRHTGFSMTRRYAIKGNTLHIYHDAKDMQNNKPFVEKREIILVDDKELEWGSDAPPGNKKLFKLY